MVTDIVNGVQKIVNVKGDHNHAAVLKRKKKDDCVEPMKTRSGSHSMHEDYDTVYVDEDLTV